MDGIVFGQYVPGNSFLHRLDPRTKLIVTVIIVWITVMTKKPIEFAGLGMFILLLYVLAGVTGRLFRVLRPGVFLVTITVVLNMIFIPGQVVADLIIFDISREGIANGLTIGIKLVLLLLVSSLVTLTTSPVRMTDGLEILMKPLKRFGLPASELAMMMSIALRFIPTFWEETDKIIKAQVSRGADFDSWHLGRRVKYLTALLVPLFVSSFRKADELAMAMEARGYAVGMQRSSLHRLQLRWRDYLVLTAAVILGLRFAVYRFLMI